MKQGGRKPTHDRTSKQTKQEQEKAMNEGKQTVMVTGACGNLGRAVATLFSGSGARLVLVDLDRERLQAIYGDENAQQMLAPANLLVQDEVMAIARAAHAQFGGIDVLCNIAGGFRMGPAVHETSDRDWDSLLDLNARTVLHSVRAVVPHMLEAGRGKIINVAANSALKGMARMGAYCASKDVVIRITEAMAAELRDSNINVNCVLPSIIDTPENRAAMPDANVKRWVAPEALAEVIAFLASDGARAINGAAIPVVGLS
jgi:NAD(P)-dependent dehydrogenase (short-subunit alcohol dehydrogenase family)